MRILIALALALSTAHAADIPQTSQRDNRIQYVNYHPGDVVVVHSSIGYVSRIVFEPGETILTPVDVGVASGWDITARGRILKIKPISVDVGDGHVLRPNPDDWNTNIAVETNKRLYDIEVRLLPDDHDKSDFQAFYRVEFRYPIETEIQARAKAAKQQADAAKMEQVQALPKPKNFNYEVIHNRRSADIAPNMVYDDGLFTYLRFPNNREVPAVFLATADGFEGKVNTHMHESHRDVMVVQRVARRLILRLGKSVVAVDNKSFDINGTPPVNGTTVPGMVRSIKQ